MRLRQAEKAFILSAPPLSLEYGDKVLVYRYTTKRWEPRIFASRNENTILVIEPDGEVQPYAITRVCDFKKGIYLPRPDIYGINRNEEELKDKDNEGTQRDFPTSTMGQDEKSTSSTDNDAVKSYTTFRDVPKFGPWSVGWKRSSEQEKSDETFAIDVEEEMELELIFGIESSDTVVLKNNDERRKEFNDAIEKEYNGLSEKETFVTFRRSDFSFEDLSDLTILKAKLVLAFKGQGTTDERKKTSLVVKATGSKDKDKRMLFTYSPTVTKSSNRLMLSVGTRKNLPAFIRDIRQAYVPTKTRILREVYVTTSKELNLNHYILWKVVRPLYSLPESGVIWFETYIAHHHDVLKVKSESTEPCLPYRFNRNKNLDGIVCLQVDDTIGAGTVQFVKEEEVGSKSLETKGAKFLTNGKGLNSKVTG